MGESHVRNIIRSLSCVAKWILMMSNSSLHFIGNGEALSGVADSWVNCRLGSGYRCGIPIWAALALGNGTYESTSTTNAAKRARRKKTYAELKELESSLLKERTHLEKEIATLQATFKEQRAKNDNFKRIKVDLNLHSARNLSANLDGAGKAISSQPHERLASSSNTACYVPSDLPPRSHPQLDSCVESNDAPARDNSFLLPDLNMVPAGEESGSEMLYGMS